MSAEDRGRAGWLACEKILEAFMAKPAAFPTQVSLSWAREALRLQAVQHIRSMSGRPNEGFMKRICSAVHAVDSLIEKPAASADPTQGIES